MRGRSVFLRHVVNRTVRRSCWPPRRAAATWTLTQILSRVHGYIRSARSARNVLLRQFRILKYNHPYPLSGYLLCAGPNAPVAGDGSGGGGGDCLEARWIAPKLQVGLLLPFSPRLFFHFFLLLLYSLYLRIFSRLSPLFIITYLFHLTYTRYRFSHVPPRLFYHVSQSQPSRCYFFLDSFLFPYPRYPYRFAPLFLLLPDNSMKSRAYRKWKKKPRTFVEYISLRVFLPLCIYLFYARNAWCNSNDKHYGIFISFVIHFFICVLRVHNEYIMMYWKSEFCIVTW